MVRIELTADDSLAAIRARSKLGMAMAAMIKMIATTISNSISEKPFCFRISFFLLVLRVQTQGEPSPGGRPIWVVRLASRIRLPSASRLLSVSHYYLTSPNTNELQINSPVGLATIVGRISEYGDIVVPGAAGYRFCDLA
jgi:hypothetical protein